MTSPGASAGPDHLPDPPFDFADPAENLTNLPGLLGHYPSGTLILLARAEGDAAPGPLLVRELDDVDGFLAAIDSAAPMMSGEGHDCADVLVVDERWPDCVGGSVPDGADVADALMAGGLQPVTYAGVRAIRPGEPVRDWRGAVIGEVGDPVSSWAAGKLYDSGEMIAADRDELRARFRPQGDDPGGEAAEALRRASGDVRRLRKGIDGDGVAEVRRYHGQWERLVAAVDDGDVLVDEALADPGNLRVLARPLVSLLLRDMTMTAVMCESAPTARVLWLRCAQLFRGTARSNALACYAIDRFVNGSPAAADAALTEALETDPEHSLSRLLRTATMSGNGRMAVQSMLEAADAVFGAVYADEGAVG